MKTWRNAQSSYAPRQLVLGILVACLAFTGVMFGLHHANALTACPCHIFPDVAPTGYSVANDGSASELGVRFKPSADGYVTGVRFYKDPTMTDTHTGSLWAPNGSLLATGTFTNETASGWQDLTFASPVAVTAGKYYTASYYAPTGKYVYTHNYFTTAVNNYPLVAPDSTTAQADGFAGNGVFTQSAGDSYPGSSFQSSNYWVDVTFRANPNGTAPQVQSTIPANGATNQFSGTDISATFDQSIDSSTISSSTVVLTDGQNNLVPTTLTYNDASKTVNIAPNGALAANATYTISIRGGPSGVMNLDSTPLAADYQWSFTTGNDQCPCSVWSNGTPAGSSTASDQPVELGETVHATDNGYLEAVRFYKPLIAPETTHTVHVWSTSGTELGSGTSSHESSYGWQEVRLNTPVAVQRNTNYIISYYSPSGFFQMSATGLATEAGSGLLRENANGAFYQYSATSVFPGQSAGSHNYWMDAVFTHTNTYTVPFQTAVTQPVDGSYGVQTNQPLTVQMTNTVDSTTVTGSLSLKNASNQSVAGTVSYDDSEHTLSFTPSSSLAANASYTLSVNGSLKDVYGTAATPSSVHFTTGSSLLTDINQGAGGPVLVLTSSAQPYDAYLAEMLRAEGINYFTVKDISQISAATLGQYRMVLLGKATLTSSQVSTLTTWVQGGGNLIAMQPDKQLAGLLGLNDQNQTLSESYLKVDTTTDAGSGVTAETMQYHGAADEYTAQTGTRVVATLFSDATTTTGMPAITEKSVGSGHAAAFVYDLPKSIALTHQGNPAWVGQDRDGNYPIRPNDLFDGAGSAPDWLNVSKAHIPQADEQQQVLVNLMLTMDKQKTPLPRFWILPHGYKSALVMTMDDHATSNSTFYVFNRILNSNPTTYCSVQDWGCSRGGSLLYVGSGLTAAQADTAQALGFRMGSHVQTNCDNFTSYSNLSSSYTSQIAAFKSAYPDLLPQTFDRTHCFVWSDWDSVPKVDVANNIHINFNYEWYPSAWTGSNAGYLTGSGLTMRFTDSGGNLIDDYQGVTDLDYENDPSSTMMNADLDNTINSNAFYGVLGTHYDNSISTYPDQLITAATSRGIPLISADQLLTWKNALGSSNFTNVSSSDSQLSFTVQVAQGGQGMQAMVPASSGNGSLSALTQNGQAVSYATNTIKGVTYAVFNAAPGSYQAQYGTPQAPTGGGTTGGSTTPAAPASSGTSKHVTAKTTRPASQAEQLATASVANPSPFESPAATKNYSQTVQSIVNVPRTTDAKGTPTWLVVSSYVAGLILLVGTVIWGVLLLRRRPTA